VTDRLASSSDLYGLPLDRFVPERAALAKALRGEGRKEEAAGVGALRKPSVAAWTVNQLVRTRRAAVTSLFDAGDALGRAQSELLAGRGDAHALREAAQRERQAVDDLAEVARGLLSSQGQEPTQATLDRVSETLHAAALDEKARAQVREACLERELRQVGFGGTVAGSGPASTVAERGRGRASGGGAKGGGAKGGGAKGGGAGAARASAPEDRKRDAERARAEKAERERAERERAEQLRSARMAEAEARRLADLTVRQVGTAQERRDRAAESLRDADDALAAARDRAEEAALAHRRAQQALEDL
jgi:hypothetical protein